MISTTFAYDNTVFFLLSIYLFAYTQHNIVTALAKAMLLILNTRMSNCYCTAFVKDVRWHALKVLLSNPLNGGIINIAVVIPQKSPSWNSVMTEFYKKPAFFLIMATLISSRIKLVSRLLK